MRMACNSTFLLDHESDLGHKVDEPMTLLAPPDLSGAYLLLIR